jgi:hypothetical protein
MSENIKALELEIKLSSPAQAKKLIADLKNLLKKLQSNV